MRERQAEIINVEIMRRKKELREREQSLVHHGHFDYFSTYLPDSWIKHLEEDRGLSISKLLKQSIPSDKVAGVLSCG